MATTTNLNTLKINYLTQAQYETALGNNQIDENELYFTPSDEVQKVSKTGDTMTGALTLPQLNIPGASDRVFSFKLSNNDTNVDIGWDWTNADGAGAALRSADPSRTDCGQFVFFARAKDTNDEPVYTQLVGTPGATNNAGILTWGGRRVVTSTNSSAVGSVNQPVYVDANGYLQVSKSFTDYLPLTGGNVTGSTSFGNSVSIDDLTVGNLTVTGTANLLNSLLVVEAKANTSSVSVAAGATGSRDITVTKSGYTPLGIVGLYTSGGGKLTWSDIYLVNSTTARAYYFNSTSAAITLSNVTVYILYIKNT